MLQEVVKMKEFNHPHIMSLIGVCLNAGVGVVMPYMANGSVLSYLKKEQETLLLQDEADTSQVRCPNLISGVKIHMLIFLSLNVLSYILCAVTQYQSYFM